MKLGLLAMAGAVFIAGMPLAGYQAKQPKVKSKKEQEALMQVQTAAQSGNPAAELTAINNVLENFADTEFKPQLLTMAMGAAQQSGDEAQVTTWAERIIANDPNDIVARVTVAETTAAHIRENDLDKADNVKKVNELAHKSLDLIQAGGSAPPGIPDDKWPDFKKELTARAWASMAQAASIDKKSADAVADYKHALDAFPSSVVTARLAKAYVENKQYDDAIASADKAMAMADATAPVKTFAQAQKDAATKLKGAK
jgi:tetratricopeptide (TPR) repeat protein